MSGAALSRIVLNESVSLPGTIRDLESFRQWARRQDCPREKHAFLGGVLWADSTPRDVDSHGDVILAINEVLHSRGWGGRYLGPGMLLSNVRADWSTLPDGAFISFDAARSGRVNRLPDDNGVGCVEIEGVPDMILEVVGDSTVEKDTVLLPPLYHRAGVPEFWRVDARNGIRFEILRHHPEGYRPTALPDGWCRSEVFGRDFRLSVEPDPNGAPLHTLEHRSLA